MIARVKNTVEYFQEFSNYFWQWAENGNVIEWKNGSTICYTEELVLLMKALTNSGVPSFGSVLLLLSACNDSWSSSSDAIGILHGLKLSLVPKEGDSDNDVLDYYINQSIKCMDMIAALPKDLKHGMQRAHLLHEVSKDANIIMQEEDLRSAANDLYSGRLNQVIAHANSTINREQYKQDLEYLVGIFHKFAVPVKLERQLRTGLFEMPAPARIELPHTPTGDLLQDLAAEHKTAGMAELAKRLIAALNIPMHSQGSSDQLFGGVSDITNRGNYDRLLLSELAYDDNVLLARLANNEALYLRREELPAQPKNKRVILVDTTLKMWGMPRVFAMSAAIACTLNVKHGEQVETLMLGGKEAISSDTQTAKGISNALEILYAALNCFSALEQYCSTEILSDKTDTFFITRTEAIHDPGFQILLTEYPTFFNFIISVNRDGEMILHEVTKGRIKQVSSAKFDLEDILIATKPLRKVTSNFTDLPAFFQQDKAPLLFPTTTLRPLDFHCFYDKSLGVVAITENRRLLHWPRRDKGAVELLETIEYGSYAFGYDGGQLLFVLININDSSKLVLYKIDVNERVTDRTELDMDKKGVLYGVYHGLCFYMRTNPSENFNISIINCITGQIEGRKTFERCAHIFKSSDHEGMKPFGGNIRKHVNNGYNVLHRVKTVGTSLSGNLSFDKKVFTIPDNASNYITIKSLKHKYYTKAVKSEEQHSLNDDCNLSLFRWADGSKAIVDSRGLMHLVSSDASLPEVTLVMVQGKTTACWSSDRKVSGNEYFIPTKGDHSSISAEDFHENYIAPIIKRINEA